MLRMLRFTWTVSLVLSVTACPRATRAAEPLACETQTVVRMTNHATALYTTLGSPLSALVWLRKYQQQYPCARLYCVLSSFLILQRDHPEVFSLPDSVPSVPGNMPGIEAQRKADVMTLALHTALPELNEGPITSDDIAKYSIPPNAVPGATRYYADLCFQGRTFTDIEDGRTAAQSYLNSYKDRRTSRLYFKVGGALLGLGALLVIPSIPLAALHGQVYSNTGCLSSIGLDGPCRHDFLPISVIGFSLGGAALISGSTLMILGSKHKAVYEYITKDDQRDAQPYVPETTPQHF